MITVLHNPNYADALWDGIAAAYLKPINIEECVPVAEVDTDAIYYAYEATQHGHWNSSWQDNAKVTTIGEAATKARSTSAGDVVVKDGETFVLVGYAFITLAEYRELYPAQTTTEAQTA